MKRKEEVKMELANSYIFMPNPYKKNDYTEKNAINLIKQILKIKEKEESLGILYKKKLITTIGINGNCFDVKFLWAEFNHYTFLDVFVTGEDEEKVIKCLEYIQSKIDVPSLQDVFIMIVSYDAISEYYCNKIYPKLNAVERNLRKLLFNIYVINFGREYYQVTVDVNLQSKIKKVIQARGNNEKKEIIRLQEFFYSMEFSDIKKLLFSESWTRFEEGEKKKFLEKNQNLSELTDDELRSAFDKFSSKSDWDRFFSDRIININVQELIENVRKSRNNIAHCKFLYETEYKDCDKSIKELNKAILSAIQISEEIDFFAKNMEQIGIAISSMTEKFSGIIDGASKAIQIFGDTLLQVSNRGEVMRQVLLNVEKLGGDLEFDQKKEYDQGDIELEPQD